MQPAQEVFGPARGGYYVAAYACPVGSNDGEFIGYYKICRRRPETYWDASDCVAKGSTRAPEPTEFLAIESAIEEAAQALNHLPAARDFDRYWVSALRNVPIRQAAPAS